MRVADSHLSTNYFASVTNMHLGCAGTADTTIYVPPIIFDRNSNSVPRLVRVADLLWCGTGLSGLHHGAAIRPPTSVYSLPLALVEWVDGWDAGPQAIGEDLHMYLKCFFAVAGNLTARTVPSAASQSNVHSDMKGLWGWLDIHRARYRQAIRHMWGSLDMGYAVRRTAELWWRRNALDSSDTVLQAIPLCHSERRYLKTNAKLREYCEDEVRGQLSTSRAPLASPSDLPITSPAFQPHSTNVAILLHRLFEAHSLPTHMVVVTVASALYTFHKSSEDIAPELAWTFRIISYLRFFGAIGMSSYLVLYEEFHRTCVRSREEEMERAGLTDHIQAGFAHRKFWVNIFDYCMFPVAGTLYGTVPAIHAQLCHFWTTDLVYSVSLKPQKESPAIEVDKIV